MKVRTERGEEFDLTTCEVCGMWWTAAKHELCPRCMASAAKEMAEQARRRVAEVLHELEMIQAHTANALEAR